MSPHENDLCHNDDNSISKQGKIILIIKPLQRGENSDHPRVGCVVLFAIEIKSIADDSLVDDVEDSRCSNGQCIQFLRDHRKMLIGGCGVLYAIVF